MSQYTQQLSQRSQSAPSRILSSQLSIEDKQKVKKRGVSLVKKVFQDVMKNLKGDQKEWEIFFQKFQSDGYDDLNQAQLARVADLINIYQLKGKESIYLYLEVQKEYRKFQNNKNQFYPNIEEIQSIPNESLDNLLRQPAEIRFKSSQKNNLPINLIILFGPQNSGKTTFISACINFIRGLEYHSLLRYTVQKKKKIIKIDDGKEQFCFIKVEAFTNPYDNRDLSYNLMQDLEIETSNRKLQSFSILYFAISTQTRIGLPEKYQVQKLLELIPQKMENFFIVKTFCTDDSAKMILFTGDQSPAHAVPEFQMKYIQYANTPDQDKQKYIFNNKLLVYEYKKEQNIQNSQNIQTSNPQNQNIQYNQNHIQIQNNEQQEINQEQQQQQTLIQVNNEQISQSQSVILELSIDNFDTTYVYWERNKKNYKQLSEDIIKLIPDQCQKEFDQFKNHLRNLQKIEENIKNLMKEKGKILSKQREITENMEKLSTIRTEIQNIYISFEIMKKKVDMKKPYANEIKILICKECQQVCHRTCSFETYNLINNCSRFKKGFCKSCFKKNDNQKCKPSKHELVSIDPFKDVETTFINVNTNIFKTKHLQTQKEQKIKEIRLFQQDIFEIQQKYLKDVQQFKVLLNSQTEVQGYLKINFEIYKKLLDQQQLDNELGILYHTVINDIFEQ